MKPTPQTDPRAAEFVDRAMRATGGEGVHTEAEMRVAMNREVTPTAPVREAVSDRSRHAMTAEEKLSAWLEAYRDSDTIPADLFSDIRIARNVLRRILSTIEERSFLHDSKITACRFCGLLHGPRCPSVQAIEYHPDGTVKRVEFVQSQQVTTGTDPI